VTILERVLGTDWVRLMAARQPRAPAGTSTGGQWVSVGANTGGAKRIDVQKSTDALIRRYGEITESDEGTKHYDAWIAPDGRMFASKAHTEAAAVTVYGTPDVSYTKTLEAYHQFMDSGFVRIVKSTTFSTGSGLNMTISGIPPEGARRRIEGIFDRSKPKYFMIEVVPKSGGDVRQAKTYTDDNDHIRTLLKKDLKIDVGDRYE